MTAASQTVPDLDCRQVEGLSDVLVQRRCGHHRRYQQGTAGRERRRRWASWDPREQKARFEGDFVQELRHAGSGSEAAWLSRGAKASQATRSAEMSRPAIPNRAAR